MSKIILYIATSMNGKIARSNGGVDWLESIPTPEGEDYGYAEFYENIGVTIQGNKTYQQVLSWNVPFPYAQKENYVITSDKRKTKDENVTFIHTDIIPTIKGIINNSDKNIWLVGGAGVNTLFLDHGLIDEIMLFKMPIILQDGIDLFSETKVNLHTQLLDSKVYQNGVVFLHYKVNPE